jgi:type II secretory pathway pseudopilin PulG
MLLSPGSVARRLHGALRREHGFTLIEAVLAMALFLGVSTALAGVLTGAISARSVASERTAAEQVANDQLEWVRSLAYADVGLTTDGNPVGDVNPNGNQSAFGGPTVPAGYTVAIRIYWIDDPVPTSFSTKANYKNVVVTVSRTRDAKILTIQSTQVGPRQRAAFGGINLGIVSCRATTRILRSRTDSSA